MFKWNNILSHNKLIYSISYTKEENIHECTKYKKIKEINTTKQNKNRFYFYFVTFLYPRSIYYLILQEVITIADLKVLF